MSRAALFMISIAVCVAALGSTSGCTKSHDVTATGLSVTSADGGTSNAGSGGGNGGGAGSLGTGSAGNAGGGAGSSAATGCNDCQPQSIMGFLNLNACCAKDDQGQDVCGLDSTAVGGPGCLPRDAPGNPDMSCPSSNMFGFTIPGCCHPDGTCGSSLNQAGLGCGPNADGTQQKCNPQGPN
jgi:hypothetical protein